MLSVVNGRKELDGQLLFADLSFCVEPGQICAIVGANGAGKTTLLRCLVDEDSLDAGNIDVFGQSPDDRSAQFRLCVAAEMGEQAVFFDSTLAEHFDLLARAYSIDSLDTELLLSSAGLKHLGARFPHTLSSGQLQRFILAATLVRPSQLVVLDEPEKGLDSTGHQWLTALLQECTSAGKAVVMATHSSILTDCADVILDLGGSS